MKIKFRKLKPEEVTFEVACKEEHIRIEGNCLVSGDAEEDRKAEQWVYDQLNKGNDWAWCMVEVTAKWEGSPTYGLATLGCCSYLSQEDFEKDVYFEEMKMEALDDLNGILENDLRELLDHADVEGV